MCAGPCYGASTCENFEVKDACQHQQSRLCNTQPIHSCRICQADKTTDTPRRERIAEGKGRIEGETAVAEELWPVERQRCLRAFELTDDDFHLVNRR